MSLKIVSLCLCHIAAECSAVQIYMNKGKEEEDKMLLDFLIWPGIKYYYNLSFITPGFLCCLVLQDQEHEILMNIHFTFVILVKVHCLHGTEHIK